MKEKKTTVITFRTTEETKKKLSEEADKRGWTVSQLVERIVANYTNPKEEKSPINFISNEITIHRIN